MKNNSCFVRNTFLFFIVMILFFSPVNGVIDNVIAENDVGVIDSSRLKSNANSYSYNVEGRSDPFKPFIAPKKLNQEGLDPNEILDENGPLTGMQLFEPGQLSLVAIMDSSRDRLAMVEDVTKKGYVLRKGDPLGRRGLVTRIEKDQVVITETARTRSGEKVQTTIVMKMKKEGEE